MTESKHEEDQPAPSNSEREPVFPIILMAGLGILWAGWLGLMTLSVLEGDPDNICGAPEVALAVAAGLTFLLTFAAFVFAIIGRNNRTGLALLSAALATGVWFVLGGQSAFSCVVV